MQFIIHNKRKKGGVPDQLIQVNLMPGDTLELTEKDYNDRLFATISTYGNRVWIEIENGEDW